MIDARDQISPSGAGNRRGAARVAASGRTRRGSSPRTSLSVKRVFSSPDVSPFDQIEWERRSAEIADDSGKGIFKQENVGVPKAWSVLATKGVVSKYFYGGQKTSQREASGRQLIHRVTLAI